MNINCARDVDLQRRVHVNKRSTLLAGRSKTDEHQLCILVELQMRWLEHLKYDSGTCETYKYLECHHPLRLLIKIYHYLRPPNAQSKLVFRYKHKRQPKTPLVIMRTKRPISIVLEVASSSSWTDGSAVVSHPSSEGSLLQSLQGM